MFQKFGFDNATRFLSFDFFWNYDVIILETRKKKWRTGFLFFVLLLLSFFLIA